MHNAKRFALYKKIHVALKQLPHMDDEGYRRVLRQNFGKESKKELKLGELIRLVDLLHEMGAEYTSLGSNKKREPHARPDWIEVPDGTAYAAEKRQICQIWRKLGYSMTSLNTRVERQFGMPSILWLKEEKSVKALLHDLLKREAAFEAAQEKAEA